MMGWIFKKSKEHTCNPPAYKPLFCKIYTGDRWQCKCGKIWVVTVLEFKGNRYSLKWESLIQYHRRVRPIPTGPIPD